MKLTSLVVLGAALVAMTVAGGIVHGRWTNRWGHHADTKSAGVRLEQLPMTIGDWHSNGNDPLDPNVANLLQCAGSVNRIYENAKTGDRVSVAILLGPSGPIAVHTPEVCYSSQNYHIEHDRTRWRAIETDEPGDELWDLRMQGNDVSAQPFRVLYGWTATKYWGTPENPRYSFGGSSYLYKLQIAGPVPSDDQKRDVCREFLAVFLPVVRKYMVEPK